MAQPKRYTITAALPYTNGPIHIGHLAGVYVPADIYARYQRLKKRDVLFVCGSDEHGVAITIKAKKEGITPQQVVDRYHNIIKKSFEDFGVSFDVYSRTSAKIHHETASDFFTQLHADGKFIEQVTEQLYDAAADQFLADRYVVGTCPNCGYESSYGDQCENCGTSHNATDLINPKSALSGSTPTVKATKHWFLPLDQYQDWLDEWIVKGHKKDWKPNVHGQVKSWIMAGLKPRAVTRDLDWGIPVPVAGGEGKVLYVWFDAPIGYISATKEWGQNTGNDWEPYWKDQDTKLLHFIGKDNIVFHCIIFPSILKAAGDYILPDNVPANEFLNLEGNKLSTSKNWAVWLHEYLEDFPDMQDVLRYTLTANAPESKDNDFTWKDFQARNNNELVAIFGNFVNRVVVLTHKYYEGLLPDPDEYTPEDLAVLQGIHKLKSEIEASLEKYRFREALGTLMKVARSGNEYLAAQEPWKTIKTAEQRTQTIMFVANQITAALAVLSEPFLPHISQKLKTMLNLDPEKVNWQSLEDSDTFLPAGNKIETNQLLFSKIEDAQIQAQLDKLEATKKANEMENAAAEPQKDTIQFDDFTKIDLRVGTILKAEKMPKTKKLMVMEVDTGIDTRTIVSGIAEHYQAEELVGKQVTVLVNLAARPLRGVDSQGMILLAEDANGKLVFVSPEEAVKNGSGIS